MDLWGNEDWWDREAEKKKPPEETDYEGMERDFYHCRACPLRREGGHGPVLSTGPCPAPLMLVGEGPGSVEDEHGLPLIGPSGQLLDRALLSVGITRDHVYVTNIVKCRPRGNRTPTQQEGYFCASRWLVREIGLVKPKVIVALGKPALRFFLGRNYPKPGTLDILAWHSGDAHISSGLSSPAGGTCPGGGQMGRILRSHGGKG